MAETSLATTVEPSPTPMTSGDPLRATIISPGCRSERTAMPYVPSTCFRAWETAAMKSSPVSNVAMRCASASVSVCETKTQPRFSSLARSAA